MTAHRYPISQVTNCQGCGRLLAEIKGEKGKIERQIVSHGFSIEFAAAPDGSKLAWLGCPVCHAKTKVDPTYFLQGFGTR